MPLWWDAFSGNNLFYYIDRGTARTSEITAEAAHTAVAVAVAASAAATLWLEQITCCHYFWSLDKIFGSPEIVGQIGMFSLVDVIRWCCHLADQIHRRMTWQSSEFEPCSPLRKIPSFLRLSEWLRCCMNNEKKTCSARLVIAIFHREDYGLSERNHHCVWRCFWQE